MQGVTSEGFASGMWSGDLGERGRELAVVIVFQGKGSYLFGGRLN